MRYGAEERHLQRLAEWRKKRGIPQPLALDEKPADIFPDLIPIWNAWHELSTSRPVGMAASGVPWSEQSRYCEDHGIDGPARLRWIRLLRAMDLVYLTHSNKRKPRKGGDSGKPES